MCLQALPCPSRCPTWQVTSLGSFFLYPFGFVLQNQENTNINSYLLPLFIQKVANYMHCPAPCLFFSRDTVEHFPHQYWEHSLLSVSAVKWSIPGKHQIRKEPPAVSTVFYHKHGCSEQSPAYVLFCACPMPQNTFSEVGSCIFNFFFFFSLCRAACGILVPWPGFEPGPLGSESMES